MARILVASLPFAGHVGAVAPVAAELQRRGHEVVAYTGRKYAGRFAGATVLPWTAATDYDDADLAATFPAIGDGKGVRGGQANARYVLFGTGPGQATDIVAEARRRPFDLIVGDQLAFGGALAGEVLGVPWVSLAVTPLSLGSTQLPPMGFPVEPGTGPLGRARDALLRRFAAGMFRVLIDPQLNRMRAAAGLGPVPVRGRLFDSLYSPYLVVAQGVDGLEHPRPELPHVHLVGRLAGIPPVSAELPPWWPDVTAARAAGRPVVHVTQGTLDVDPADLLRPALAGLAGEDVLVVASTGGAPPDRLGPLPGNARAAAFLPHDRLLPVVDVMVTNGGWGGVLGAVQAGVPLVVAGGSLDKPEVARRVARSGAGLNLRTGTPGADRIRRAVRTVLAGPAFRERARELGAAVTAAGGVPRAADLIEGVLGPPRSR
jgi:UDP:flavonoid glycosyltransferase YjiC (YdhE family)